MKRGKSFLVFCSANILSLAVSASIPPFALAFPRGHGENYPLPKPQIREIREKNKENTARLKPGMSLGEVDAIMGREKDIQTYYILQKQKNLLSNPLRETAIPREGKNYLVLYYYTDLILKDGQITDEELTPVLLESGVVQCVGWESCRGWSHILPPLDTSRKQE